MTTRRTRVLGLGFFAGFLIGAGTYQAAYANTYTADADCDGLTVSIPRTEDGTTVTVTRNGATVRTVRNDTFGAPVFVPVPSPDQSVTQAWRVTIAGYNGTQVYAETVAPCISSTTIVATTTPPSSSTTTTPTTSVVPTTTVVAVTTPPLVPTTTVVTPPGRPLPTTTTTPTTWRLPDTGSDWWEPVAFVAGAMIAVGAFLVLVRRRGGVA